MRQSNEVVRRLVQWLAAAVAFAALLVLLAGCVTESAPKSRSSLLDFGDAPIEELNLLAIPVAINFDAEPGLDGFVIKVYATNRKRPKPMRITSGTLDVSMFDGMPRGTPDSPPQPLRTWTYSADELKPFEFQTSIGTGYQLALAWGDAKPTSNRISVACRYSSPQGTTILSAPSIIAVALKESEL